MLRRCTAVRLSAVRHTLHASVVTAARFSPHSCTGPTLPFTPPFVTQLQHRAFAKKAKKAKKGKAGKHPDEDAEQGFDQDAVLDSLSNALSKSIESLKRKHSTLRTGRASPNMLNTVSITAYGASTPLQSLASVTVRGPQLLVVIPHDPSLADDICQGIKDCGMSLNPEVQANKSIQIKVPKMSKQVRTEMSKQISTAAEDCKGRIRQARSKAMTSVKKNAESEDERKAIEKLIQKQVDEHVLEVTELSKQKDSEISGNA